VELHSFDLQLLSIKLISSHN